LSEGKPRRDELVTVDALKHVLLACCGCNDVAIRCGDDPPDFVVTIDGEVFPAEVTGIVSRQQERYRAQYRTFTNAIRDRAASLSVLSGEYVFVVSGLPRIPKQTSDDGRQMLDTAVNYITATQQENTASEDPLDDSGKFGIRKLGSTGSTVYNVPRWSPKTGH
jgi:hypothetical protein